MNSAVILARLRRFLLVVSALFFAGTLLELWLIGHMEDFVQWLPFALCGLGLVAILGALVRPRRAAALGLRVVMGVVALGSLFGVYEHVANNLAFHREIYPNAPASDSLMSALGGANPLLAPGIMAAAAVLAIAATYHHPAVRSGDDELNG